MSKRLQVLLDEAELKEIGRLARSQRLTVAQWVRQALRAARRKEPAGDPSRKIEAVRAAAEHSFPAPPIGKMLEEIEHGYTDSSRR